MSEQKPRKLSRRERKLRRAEKVKENLNRDLKENLGQISANNRSSGKFSPSNAFSNVYTATSIYQGGSPGGGKRR